MSAKLGLAIAFSCVAAVAQAADLRLLSSWDKNYANNPVVLNPFMQGIEAAHVRVAASRKLSLRVD